MQMVMTSDETQIQSFADCLMSQAKRVEEDNRKNLEYHVVAAIRRLRKIWQSVGCKICLIYVLNCAVRLPC